MPPVSLRRMLRTRSRRRLVLPVLAALVAGLLATVAFPPGTQSPADAASVDSGKGAAGAASKSAGAGSELVVEEEQPDAWWNPPNRPAEDSEINASGGPFTGTVDGKVKGWVDTHNHVNSNEGFGGRLICGAPFSRLGIADALKDCKDHEIWNGALALFENLTSDSDWQHDSVGWPTFKDWPKVESMSHQAGYYAWIERSWRSGQRVLVNDLVSNGVICSLPILPKDYSCNEMDAIRRQARKAYEMQDYIDDIYGGPGKGFYRIVTSPTEATEVIKSGKLAVVLGVETSEPFGCKQILGVAQCSTADIDRGLDEMKNLGVSSMFLCHKFDNALCGVRFDPGTQGTIINMGQFISTGTWWTTEKCTTAMSDNAIGNAPAPVDVVETLPEGAEVPVYNNTNKCNVRGLTNLGEYMLQGMMKRNMMVELDHMSAKAATRTMEVLEANGYPGVVSSHGWADKKFAERIYRLGGMKTGYPSGADGFVAEWREQKDLRAKYGKAYGFGLDYNGVGSHPAREGEESPNKVTYPYTAVDGHTVMDKQVTGQRTWNVNTDGAAHYGLVPDWIRQLQIASNGEITEDLMNGAQSYLDTWSATTSYGTPRNLATSRLTQASSQEWTINNRLQAKSATDGSRSTRWASGNWGTDPQWIRVDLGARTNISRVTVDWEGAFAKAYEVQVSDDASTWRTVWRTGAGNGGLDTAMFDTTKARWVRILNTQRGTNYGYSIYEIGIFAR